MHYTHPFVSFLPWDQQTQLRSESDSTVDNRYLHVLPQFLLIALGMFATAFTTGCTPEQNPSPQQSQKTSAGASGSGNDSSTSKARSTVPLRVTLVAPKESKDLISRQWQSTSEQPLSLNLLTIDELLASKECETDLLVYPAYLIGELISRDWITARSTAGKTNDSAASRPATVGSGSVGSGNADSGAVDASSNENTLNIFETGAYLDQTKYARKSWGHSLGTTSLVIMANRPFPEDLSATDPPPSASHTYERLIDWFRSIGNEPMPQSEKNSTPSDTTLDARLLCERFLFLWTSLSSREPQFGMLLNPEQLQSRLRDEEALTAAKTLLELHQLNSDAQALLGDMNQTWQALASERPNLSFGYTPLPNSTLSSEELNKVTNIQVLPPPRMSFRSPRVVSGWNSGHGLMVSLTNNCRQTTAANEFARWLGSENTRQALARFIPGVECTTLYAPGSSAWQAQRVELRIAQQPRLPQEPRMPLADALRVAMGEEIASMLQKKKSPEQTLEDLDSRWQRLIEQVSKADLKTSYEQSLGL